VLTTFHRAKGLQWPTVIVLGLGAGLMPIASAQTPAAIDEERRLLYVALTRSEEELWCSWYGDTPLGRDGNRGPSPWLEAIQRSITELEKEAAPRQPRKSRDASRSCDAHWPGDRARRRRPIRPGKVGPPDRSEVGMSELLEQLAQGRRREQRPRGRIGPARLHARRGAHVRAGRSAGCRPAGFDGRGVRDPAGGERTRPPVVARGSGTGLSGAAVPVADGILLAFDRMKRIVEIDTENQVAVVEPGVTLEQLNGELAPLGLIYRCRPVSRAAPSEGTWRPMPVACAPSATG